MRRQHIIAYCFSISVLSVFFSVLILHCFCGLSVKSDSECNDRLGVRYLLRGWQHGELVHSGVSSLEIDISGPSLLPGKLRFAVKTLYGRHAEKDVNIEKFDT